MVQNKIPKNKRRSRFLHFGFLSEEEHRLRRLKWVSVVGILFLIFNFSYLGAQTGAKYLVIAHDNFVEAVKPLVEWKTKKGIEAVCVKLSQIGNTPNQIKSFIQTAYDTWNPRPEYILLVGAPEFLPSYNNDFDDYYADMTGNYRIELCIGRFHCATAAQCSLLVAKSIGYEKSEAVQDSAWFDKGTTIVREDNPPDPYYQADCRYVRDLWVRFGHYAQVDSFINTMGHNANDVVNAINNGRAYVVYRGQGVSYWWSPFNVYPSNTNNGYKLPVVISATCATMTLAPGEHMLGDDFVRVGTVQNPKGAVAFFGTTLIGSHVSNYRGAVTKGFFHALYEDSIYTLGGACKRAKFIMDSLYPSQSRYMEWNLLGDPELNLWTTKPQELTVLHDTIVFLHTTDYQVWVGYSGTPISNALVCLMMDSTIYTYGRTDSDGYVTLSFTPQHIGTLEVTVTAQNYFPYEGTARVTVGNTPYVRYHHNTINDQAPGGNGDNHINPGETIDLTAYLINSGNQTADNVMASLSTSDQFVVISESISGFGDIAPGNIVGATSPFCFSVAPSCTNGHEIGFGLHITDNSSNFWDSQFSVLVEAGKLVINSYRVNDSAPGGNGNGSFGPAENAKLILTLDNSGLGNLNQVFAWIRTFDPYVAITDSFGYFGDIDAGSNRNNNLDPFAVSLAPNLPRDYPLQFSVYVRGSGGTYNYADDFQITISSDQGISSDPTGPDDFGYYCYDNTDVSSGRAPTYDWFEIAPPGPGSIISQITNADASLDTLVLPFSFQYYGQNWNEVTVASNGFLTMGRTGYRYGYNSPIPDTSGPRAMIAPFWDDLNPDESNNGGNGDIYQYFDEPNHRWIFEFKEVAHFNRNSVRETFQVILLDPAHYPTPTGDGEIIFQYQTVADATSNTVGIENYAQTIGIQYLYENNRPSTAALLNGDRALRFTTLAPEGNSPWLILLSINLNDSVGGNNNRIPEPGEGIELVINLINRGAAPAENVIAKLRNSDGNALVIDSIANFGTIEMQGQANNQNQPYFFQISGTPSDTVLDFNLVINATGYNTIQYLAVGLNGNPGVLESASGGLGTSRLECQPNPFSRMAKVKWQIPDSEFPISNLQIKIYDAIGRLINCLKQSPGHPPEANWDAKDNHGKELGAGIYFITLSFKTKEGQKSLVKKITISR